MVINLPILCKARQKPVQRGQEGSGRRGLEQLLQKCGWPSENEGHWELGPSSGYQHRFWDHETDKNNVYETLAIFTMHHFWAHQSDREVRRGLWFHLHRIKNIRCPPTINNVWPFLVIYVNADKVQWGVAVSWRRICKKLPRAGAANIELQASPPTLPSNPLKAAPPGPDTFIAYYICKPQEHLIRTKGPSGFRI